MPRRSSDKARQTLEEHGKDRLIGALDGRWILSCVFSSTMRAASLISRSRRVSNCRMRQIEPLGMTRRTDRKSQ
jgi:hypothetical protein